MPALYFLGVYTKSNTSQSLPPATTRAHPIIAADPNFWTDDSNASADFRHFEARFERENKAVYWGAVKSLDRVARTAVVRTTPDRCDVPCSIERCEGSARLRLEVLVEFEYHTGGDDAGSKFVTAVAERCTPVSSRTGSPMPDGLGRPR